MNSIKIAGTSVFVALFLSGISFAVKAEEIVSEQPSGATGSDHGKSLILKYFYIKYPEHLGLDPTIWHYFGTY